MKKNLFILSALGLSAASSLMLSACRDYDVMDEGIATEIAARQEFYDNFVKEFGTPDPNHTWGWGAMTPEAADALLGVSTATRADGDYSHGGRVNVNRNEWCNAYNPTSLLNVYGVPGWPNDDGRYYAQSGDYTNGHYTIYNEGSQPSSVNMPNGDVTEYEILWVSDKVHKLGADIERYEIPLHVSDYYIQAVSCDGDYANNDDYLAGNYKKYGNNYDNYKMDHLLAYSLVGNAETHINNNNAGINEKPQTKIGQNSGRNIIYVQSAGTEDFKYHPSNATNGVYYDKLVLVEFTWTEPLNPDWSKVGSGSGKYSFDQIIEHPEYLDPQGKTIQRTGYYICFDFQCEKTSEGWPKYEGDNVYDNWILKLSPGIPIQKNRWPKRLMCEDLGNTFDFDFNDAVFDLSFAQNVADNTGKSYDMIVVIQAAGGTMPITVALEGSNMEIHHLLGGNDSSTPVNVIKGGKKAAPAEYRVKNVFTTDPTLVPMDAVVDEEENTIGYVPSDSQNETLLAQMAAAAFKMKIYIQNGSTKYSVSGYELYQGMRKTDGTGYNDGNKGTNVVPQLFNCSTDAKWTYENGHIKNAYKHFIDWVHDEQCDYRLRWDEKGYYKRGETESDLPSIVPHIQTKIDSWIGSWDYGPKNATTWGSSAEFIDKSKCWGGSGAE